MVAHGCHLSPQKAEAREEPVGTSLSYIKRPCPPQKKPKNTSINQGFETVPRPQVVFQGILHWDFCQFTHPILRRQVGTGSQRLAWALLKVLTVQCSSPRQPPNQDWIEILTTAYHQLGYSHSFCKSGFIGL